MNPHQLIPAAVNRLVFVLGVVAVLAASARPAWADADYHSIVALNPFRLKPILPPTPTPLAPPAPLAPLAAVELTGIADLLSIRKACLEIVPGPGKPMLKPVLAEGERSDSIEVISIDMVRNEVVIRNGRVTTNLTFKVAKASGASAVAVPALPAVPTLSRPVARSQQVIVTGGPTTSGLTASSGTTVPGVSSLSRAKGAALSPEAAVVDLERKRLDHPTLPYPPTLISPRAPIPLTSGQR